MQTWAIGEIASRAGIPTSTIRYYEQIELLPPAKRVNGRRRYDDSILQMLNIIRLAQQAGFSLDEIQELVHDYPVDEPPSARWQAIKQRKLADLDKRLQTIQEMKALLEQTLDCQCDTVEECDVALFSV